MRKKQKHLWLWALWGLVALAAWGLYVVPARHQPASRVWKVPVNIDEGGYPDLSRLNELWALPPHLFDQEKPVVGAQPVLPQPATEQPLPFEEKILAPGGHFEEAPSSSPDPRSGLPPAGRAKGRIALILDDVGMVPALSARAIALPGAVALSFLPYAPHVQEQVNRAKAKGHPVMLHLPMQPMGGQNPGPDALLASDPDETIQIKAYRNLERFHGYDGVNNHMGSRLTPDRPKMRVLMAVLQERGVYFVDSMTHPGSVAYLMALEEGLSAARRDVFLDDTPSAEAIRKELARAEALARRKGSALAIGHPHAVTLGVLEEWLRNLPERGIELVPVTELLQKP